MTAQNPLGPVQPIFQIERDCFVHFHAVPHVELSWLWKNHGRLLNRSYHEGCSPLIELFTQFGRGGDAVLASGSIAGSGDFG